MEIVETEQERFNRLSMELGKELDRLAKIEQSKGNDEGLKVADGNGIIEELNSYFKQLEDLVEKMESGVNALELKKTEEELQKKANHMTALAEQIQNIQSPRSTTVLTDKVTRTLFSGKVAYGEKVPLKMEQGVAKKKSDEITTYIALDYESIEDVIPDNINGNDINLTEAIISLVKENEQEDTRIFTFNQIYRVLKKNPNTRPNKRGLELLEEKLIKQMRTIFDINAIGEKRYYEDLEINRRTNFLKAEILTVRYGNSEVKALKVDEMPLIYQYAKAKGQLTTIPFELTDNKLIKTDAVLNLEKYILRSIAQMKNRSYLSRSMRFETIYENMNFTQKTKSAIDNAKSRTIRNTEDILKELVDCGYIKGFEFKLANKGKYESVKIEL